MADLIVVLDGAHVAEAGSHDELLERNGFRYAELYRIHRQRGTSKRGTSKRGA